MHHYRCQNVHITATASERIIDTLDFFPHNSPMPQMSSMDRLLMTAQDKTDALKQPNPNVPFATIEDDTISALATLTDTFTHKKVQKDSSSRNPTGTSQGCRTQTTGSTCPTNIRIATQTPISNQITDTSQPKILCQRQ
jgi:hypothetical protein